MRDELDAMSRRGRWTATYGVHDGLELGRLDSEPLAADVTSVGGGRS